MECTCTYVGKTSIDHKKYQYRLSIVADYSRAIVLGKIQITGYPQGRKPRNLHCARPTNGGTHSKGGEEATNGPPAEQRE